MTKITDISGQPMIDNYNILKVELKKTFHTPNGGRIYKKDEIYNDQVIAEWKEKIGNNKTDQEVYNLFSDDHVDYINELSPNHHKYYDLSKFRQDMHLEFAHYVNQKLHLDRKRFDEDEEDDEDE